MELLFVHDHYFTSFSEAVYSDKYPYVVFERYLRIFDKISVWGRMRKINERPNNLPVSSGSNIDFYFGENISSLSAFLKRRKNEKIKLQELVKNTDFIIARLPSEYGLMAVQLAKEMGKSYGIEVVACAWDALWNYGSLKGKLYAPILYKRMQNEIAQSDYTVYVSNRFLQERYPPKKDAVVANVSNVELETVSDKILSTRLKRLKQKNEKIIIGTIGSLKTRYKGIHIAIQALSKLHQNNIEFEYHVLGSGENGDYAALAKDLGISKRVHFDGTLPSGGPVLKWLDNIDIYLQPSFTEGLPRAVIEAMSRGCPVIGSRVGGIPELLASEWLHKPGDDDQLYRLIKHMISDKQLMIKAARNNHKLAKNYSKDVLDYRRDRFLRKLANN